MERIIYSLSGIEILEEHELEDFESISKDSLSFISKRKGWDDLYKQLKSVIENFENFEQYLNYSNLSLPEIENINKNKSVTSFDSPTIHFVNKNDLRLYFSISVKLWLHIKGTELEKDSRFSLSEKFITYPIAFEGLPIDLEKLLEYLPLNKNNVYHRHSSKGEPEIKNNICYSLPDVSFIIQVKRI